MKEIVEFRISEEKADKFLRLTDGERVGKNVRKLLLPISDPLVSKIVTIQKELAQSGDYLFLYSTIYRCYTEDEIRGADALLVIVKHIFEPAGEQCGTHYDESSACTFCGAGGQQVSDLILETRSLSKKSNLGIAKTIAGEIVVSQSFADVFHANRLRGAEFRPVRQRKTPVLAVPGWYQLLVTSKPLDIVAPTRAGLTSFDVSSEQSTNQVEAFDQLRLDGSWCDRHGQYRCPLGHTIGLNLLSELSVRKEDSEEWDIALTKQMIGVRRGLLRPEPLLVCSGRLREVLLHHGVRGMAFEIVHLVPGVRIMNE
jgi:hypothetical protein